MEMNSEVSAAAGMLSLLPLLLLIAAVAVAVGFAVRRRKRVGVAAETMGRKVSPARRPQTILILLAFALLVGLYILGVALYGYKGFTKLQTILDVFRTNAALICLACGMTCVMITGGVDLSVGALVALDCMILVAGMEKLGLSPTLLVPLVLGLGVVFGLIQGYLIGYLKIQPFLVTLAGMYICRGMTAVVSTEPVSITSDTWFKELARLKIRLPFGQAMASGKREVLAPYVSAGMLISLGVLLLTFLLLRFTRLGRNLYAVGGKKQGALPDDKTEKRTKLLAYTLCGLLTSIGGVLYCLNTMYGTTTQALGLEMKAISSAIIGGVVMTGGAGSVFGAFIGVLVNGVVTTLVSYNPDLSRLGGTLPNIAAAALMLLFLIIQRAVLKGQMGEDQPEPPQETPEEPSLPPEEMNDSEYTE